MDEGRVCRPAALQRPEFRIFSGDRAKNGDKGRGALPPLRCVPSNICPDAASSEIATQDALLPLLDALPASLPGGRRRLRRGVAQQRLSLRSNTTGVITTKAPTRLFGDPMSSTLLGAIYHALAERSLLMVMLAPRSARELELAEAYLLGNNRQGAGLAVDHPMLRPDS